MDLFLPLDERIGVVVVTSLTDKVRLDVCSFLVSFGVDRLSEEIVVRWIHFAVLQLVQLQLWLITSSVTPTQS